ncbi:hypothetical protein CWI38_0863p0010 [Hamiltosporidium tvaerminnensis]|uniref:MIF4G domain-containing protein n=1 Tax=Hamiltosporidium tvaerminnensis TaxID=1176355 RepID=A0A4Q9LWG9_9MICR|nr:hypothetical protein CWI38_0863p0010 [Hamiltosporidium tvaerminnensis]
MLTKRIIYRPSEFLFVVEGKHPSYHSHPRIKSAPPIPITPIVEPLIKPPTKESLDLVFADGTVLTREMVEDYNDYELSDEESLKEAKEPEKREEELPEKKEEELPEKVSIVEKSEAQNIVEISSSLQNLSIKESEETLKIEENPFIQATDITEEIIVNHEELTKETVEEVVEDFIPESIPKTTPVVYKFKKTINRNLPAEETPVYKFKSKKVSEVVEKQIPTHIYKVSDIFALTKRNPVEIKIDKNIFPKISTKVPHKTEFSKNKDDPVAKFRLNLNRVTDKNVRDVIESLIQQSKGLLKAASIAKMAQILFEKAVNESTFINLYAFMASKLNKVLMSDVEKKSEICDRTVFSSTLLNLVEANINETVLWETKGDDNLEKINKALEKIKLESRALRMDNVKISEETERENLEYERECILIEMKDRKMGAVRFFSLLYDLDVIPYNSLSLYVKKLFLDLTYENLEILSVIFEILASKLKTNRCSVQLFNEMRETLVKNKSIFDNRLRFMIDEILEKNDATGSSSKKLEASKITIGNDGSVKTSTISKPREVYRTAKKNIASTNRFSALKDLELESSDNKVELNSEPQILDKIEINSKPEILTKEELNKISFVRIKMEDFSSMDDEEEEWDLLVNDVAKDIKSNVISKEDWCKGFFVFCMESSSDEIVEKLVLWLKKLSKEINLPSEIKIGVEWASQVYPEMHDFPLAERRLYVLLVHLRATQSIDKSWFLQISNPLFKEVRDCILKKLAFNFKNRISIERIIENDSEFLSILSRIELQEELRNKWQSCFRGADK